MTLSQMRHFKAVCQYKNITRAAQKMHITQPSISSSIKELEVGFGVNLFHRLQKRLSLTQEGEYFLEKTSSILEQIDLLEQHMKDFGNKKNLIRIGVPPMIGTFLFPAILEQFHENHPEINIEIKEHGSLATKQLVKDDELDVALVISGEDIDDSINKMHILDTCLYFYVSPSHRLAGCSKIDLKMIADEPLVLFKDGSFQNTELTEQFAKLGISPQVLLTSSQLYTIKKIVAKGHAGAFLFREISAIEPELVGIELSTPIPVEICLVWKKNSFVYSDTAKFIKTVADIFNGESPYGRHKSLGK